MGYGVGHIWELSMLSIKFFCKPKTGLRNKVY